MREHNKRQASEATLLCPECKRLGKSDEEATFIKGKHPQGAFCSPKHRKAFNAAYDAYCKGEVAVSEKFKKEG